MNDNALSGCHMPNYGHLCQDAPVEPPYITEVGTLRKLYKHPPCEICGTSQWTYAPVNTFACGACKLGRVEANEDERVALVLDPGDSRDPAAQGDLWGCDPA